MNPDSCNTNSMTSRWKSSSPRNFTTHAALLLGLLWAPYLTSGDEVPCLNGIESMKCSRHADNNAGKIPAYPAYGEAVQFRQFGTQAVRVTENGKIEDQSLRRHAYSTRQAWNADETLLDLRGEIVDATSYTTVLDNVPLSSERNWSNKNPDLIYGIRFNPKPNEFVILNVRSETLEVLYRFDTYEKCTIGEHKGSLSNDDRYVVFVCTDAEKQRTLISFDIESQTIMGQMKARENLSWATFTHTGRFVVVKNNQSDSESESELVRYTPSLKQRKVLAKETNHGDLGIDHNGEDVYVQIHWKSLSYVVISTGQWVELGIASRFNPVGHGHVSCRSIHRPGWCFLSSNDGALGAFRLGINESMLASETATPGAGKEDLGVDANEFEQWGHHFSSNATYESQAKVSVSPSGNQAIFSTDWGGSQETNDFVLTPAHD